jgi:hypothetical protein
MEPLESKLDRLLPEQRKEIEDFVDFLLSRSGQVFIPPDVSCNPPPVQSVAPPPLSLIEPEHGGETRPVSLHDLARTDDRTMPLVGGDEPASPPFQEIGGGNDWATHDYMDYGQFDQQPSPATEAVKKVRRKIIAREEQDKPHHLLDWVD